MSGRIRTIKPELVENAAIAHLSHEAFRTFICLITLADDYGNLAATPKRLQGIIFWGTPSKAGIEQLLDELEKANKIQRYVVQCKEYLFITGWYEHQYIQKRGKPRVPAIDEADVEQNLTKLNKVGDNLDGLGSGIRDQGKGSQEGVSASPHDVCKQILASLSLARKRVNKAARDLRPTQDNLKYIKERLKAGATVEECMHVIAIAEQECLNDLTCYKWFDAITPFRPDNFAKKLAMDQKLIGNQSNKSSALAQSFCEELSRNA